LRAGGASQIPRYLAGTTVFQRVQLFLVGHDFPAKSHPPVDQPGLGYYHSSARGLHFFSQASTAVLCYFLYPFYGFFPPPTRRVVVHTVPARPGGGPNQPGPVPARSGPGPGPARSGPGTGPGPDSVPVPAPVGTRPDPPGPAPDRSGPTGPGPQRASHTLTLIMLFCVRAGNPS
jgi:hypothetical protein